jgi:hypothetical protein
MEKPKVEVGRWDERGSSPEARPSSPVEQLEALAWLLDSSIPVPGLPFRVGLESLLGLIPVVGDAIGALISSYILMVGAKMGVPRVTLMRMGLNVLVEAAVGVVPVLGDVFDFAWKANKKNVELLRKHVENPSHARKADWVFAAIFIVTVAAVLALLGWAAFALGRAMVRSFGA